MQSIVLNSKASERSDEIMTREQLEDYPNIVTEIADLQEYLHTVVGDTVQDGSSGYPHPILIRGLPAGDAERRRIQALTAQKAEIEQFVETLSDTRARRLLKMHYIFGWTWAKVSYRTGKSTDSNKKYLQRFFTNVPQCPRMSRYNE